LRQAVVENVGVVVVVVVVVRRCRPGLAALNAGGRQGEAISARRKREVIVIPRSNRDFAPITAGREQAGRLAAGRDVVHAEQADGLPVVVEV
jgi:hypothetical protein